MNVTNHDLTDSALHAPAAGFGDTDLATFDEDHLDTVAAELNGRPRQTLGWMTPSRALDHGVAMTP